jgi:hypothetical protein
MSVITSCPLFAPCAARRIVSEIGGVLGFEEAVALKPDERNVGHVFLTVCLGPMSQLDQEIDDYFLPMLPLLESFLAAVDRPRVAATKPSIEALNVT